MSYSDRLIEAYNKIVQGDYINALIQICINLDAIAKVKYGGKPGIRIKQYVRQNQYVITRISMLHLEVHGDMVFEVGHDKKYKFEEIFYKLIRCALLHEGELDPKIKIVESPCIGVDSKGAFLLSKHMIAAFLLLLISEPKNKNILWPVTSSFSIADRTIRFQDIQGSPQKLVELFRSMSGDK